MSSVDQKYRAQKLGLSEHYTEDEWVALILRFEHRCAKCGARQPLTPDHIQPLARGGANTIDNIQPLCLPCNLSKNVAFVDYRDNPFQGKPFERTTDQLSIRLPDSLYTQLVERAKLEQRTVSNLIVHLLTEAMKKG